MPRTDSCLAFYNARLYNAEAHAKGQIDDDKMVHALATRAVAVNPIDMQANAFVFVFVVRFPVGTPTPRHRIESNPN